MRWLGVHASSAGCAGSFPGRGIKTKVPTCCTAWPNQKKKKIRAEINEIETTKMIKRLTILRAGLFKDRRFPSGLVVKNLPVNAGDMVSISDPVDPTCHGTAKPTCYTY